MCKTRGHNNIMADSSSVVSLPTSRVVHNEICSKVVSFQEIKWIHIHQEHRKLHISFEIQVFIYVQSGTGTWLSEELGKIISRSELKITPVTYVRLVQEREMFIIINPNPMRSYPTTACDIIMWGLRWFTFIIYG